MIDITVKRATKMKDGGVVVVVKLRKEWCEVLSVVPWGRMWMVKTEGTYFVVDATYRGLQAVTTEERSALLEGKLTSS